MRELDKKVTANFKDEMHGIYKTGWCFNRNKQTELVQQLDQKAEYKVLTGVKKLTLTGERLPTCNTLSKPSKTIFLLIFFFQMQFQISFLAKNFFFFSFKRNPDRLKEWQGFYCWNLKSITIHLNAVDKTVRFGNTETYINSLFILLLKMYLFETPRASLANTPAWPLILLHCIASFLLLSLTIQALNTNPFHMPTSPVLEQRRQDQGSTCCDLLWLKHCISTWSHS